jgi:hypothetical protein
MMVEHIMRRQESKQRDLEMSNSAPRDTHGFSSDMDPILHFKVFRVLARLHHWNDR